MNLPLPAHPSGARRQLVLCWNKDAPYSVRILTTDDTAGPLSDEAYKVEFAGLPAAMRHCAHIVSIEELPVIYETTMRAHREHRRGWTSIDPRKTATLTHA
jgi:hypothetical protein